MQAGHKEPPVNVEETLKPVPISAEESLKLNSFLGRVCSALKCEDDLDSKVTEVLEGWRKETDKQ